MLIPDQANAPTTSTAPLQRAQWKLMTGATAGYISDGYTLGVVGIALASAQSQLALTATGLGMHSAAQPRPGTEPDGCCLGGGFYPGLHSRHAARRHEAGRLELDSRERCHSRPHLRTAAIGCAGVTAVADRLCNRNAAARGIHQPTSHRPPTSISRSCSRPPSGHPGWGSRWP